MSYTEIYKFKKNGEAEFFAETKNSHRGAMAIWHYLEDKYLPAVFIPFPPRTKTSRTVMGMVNFDSSIGPMQDIWDLFSDERMSNPEKTVLASTFDNIVVYKERFDTLIEHFEAFELENCSIKEQAEIIKQLRDDEDCIAIGWNQTSVNADTWANFNGYDEEKEEELPYNILTQSEHSSIFDRLEVA